MVFEMAHIDILAGKQREFEAAVQQALPLFARAKGCHGAELHHIVERDTSYVLLVRWNTVEDHMVDFRPASGSRSMGGNGSSLPRTSRPIPTMSAR